MYKKLVIMIIVLVLCSGAWMTSRKIHGKLKKEKQEVQYTNFFDEASKQQVKELLYGCDVKEDVVTAFLDWITDYNSRIDQTDLLSDGEQPDYSEICLEARYLKNGQMQMDPNGRLTSFLLMKDFVQGKNIVEEPDPYLMFDLAAAKEDPVYLALRNSMDCFTTLMNPVKVYEADKVADHVRRIQNEWKKRKIRFNENANVELIMMFLHDPYEQKRYVGHAGIWIRGKEESYFIEKYSSGYPYQMTRFLKEEELISYLLARKDIYGDKEELSPIIMKNNSILFYKS